MSIKLVIDEIDLDDIEKLTTLYEQIEKLLPTKQKPVVNDILTITEQLDHIDTLKTEIDSEGVVYDPAIHSSSKSKTKDGKWRKIREVKTEPLLPPPPNEDQESFEYVDFIDRVSKKIKNKEIPKKQLDDALAIAGLKSPQELREKTHLIPLVEEYLK